MWSRRLTNMLNGHADDLEWGLCPLSSRNPPSQEARDRFPRIDSDQRGPCRKRPLDKYDLDPFIHWLDLRMGRTPASRLSKSPSQPAYIPSANINPHVHEHVAPRSRAWSTSRASAAPAKDLNSSLLTQVPAPAATPPPALRRHYSPGARPLHPPDHRARGFHLLLKPTHRRQQHLPTRCDRAGGTSGSSFPEEEKQPSSSSTASDTSARISRASTGSSYPRAYRSHADTVAKPRTFRGQANGADRDPQDHQVPKPGLLGQHGGRTSVLAVLVPHVAPGPVPEATIEALRSQVVKLQGEKEQLIKEHHEALDAQKTALRELKEQAMQAASKRHEQAQGCPVGCSRLSQEYDRLVMKIDALAFQHFPDSQAHAVKKVMEDRVAREFPNMDAHWDRYDYLVALSARVQHMRSVDRLLADLPAAAIQVFKVLWPEEELPENITLTPTGSGTPGAGFASGNAPRLVPELTWRCAPQAPGTRI
ncbi:hypothetical protein QYE76_005430 [Lolium multiflorum]|uniref:Uncharacterized protein n=1 Tax=Lolium multiflorum TaxID=4521 RepID=A0AAD8RSZ5_LOLMU|nr:hypothetical protein QYE76_005430 [Lolium multiflorum]